MQVNNIFFNLWNWKMVMMFAQFFVQWAILVCWPYRIIMYHQWNTRWYTQPTSIHHHSYSWCNVVLQQQVKDTMTRWVFGLLLHWNKSNKIWHSFGIIETLKDVIKQVVPLGIPPYEIHESQMVRQLFFWWPDHAKYSKKLIEYLIIELKNNEDVLKVLAELLEAFLNNRNFNYFQQTSNPTIGRRHYVIVNTTF